MPAPALPSLTPTPGLAAKVKVTPSGGSAVVVPGTNAKISPDAKLKDVSNFRDGRIKVATLEDANFSLDVIWDSAANPTLDANGGLKIGKVVWVELLTGAGSNEVSGNFTIGTSEYDNAGVEDVLVYHLTGALLGTLTSPSA